MFRSFLTKLGLLVATAAVVLWIGWPMPRPAPSDPEPRAVDGVTRDSRSPARGAASLPEGVGPDRPDHKGRQGAAVVSALAPRPSARVDINRATVEELQALPGIGERLAKRVVERRLALGSFRTVEELLEIKGIGEKRLDQLRPFLPTGKGSPNTDTPWQGGHGRLTEKRKL